MTNDHLPLLLAAALATACATSAPAPAPAPPTAAPAASTAAAEEPPAVTEPGAASEASPAPAAPPAAAGTSLCWESEETITLAAGGTQPGARRVLRMSWDAAAGRVLQEALRYDPNPQVAPRLFAVTWQLDGDAFTLGDEAGRIGGSGTVTGDGWPWSGWSSDSRIASGIRITERATIRDDGVLVLDRQAFGPDGGAVMTLHEEGTPLAAEECARRLAEAAAVG